MSFVWERQSAVSHRLIRQGGTVCRETLPKPAATLEFSFLTHLLQPFEPLQNFLEPFLETVKIVCVFVGGLNGPVADGWRESPAWGVSVMMMLC